MNLSFSLGEIIEPEHKVQLIMKNQILFLLIIGMFLSSCSSSLKVISDYDSATDFSKYDSFTVAEADPGKTGISELNLRRIVRAVQSELTAKGLEDSDNADLQVHIHGLVQDKTTTDVYTDYYGYGRYRRGFGYGTASTRVDVNEYTEGTLIVDLVDVSADELVWQGMGTAKLHDNPEGREERIREAVTKILAGFPPSK